MTSLALRSCAEAASSCDIDRCCFYPTTQVTEFDHYSWKGLQGYFWEAAPLGICLYVVVRWKWKGQCFPFCSRVGFFISPVAGGEGIWGDNEVVVDQSTLKAMGYLEFQLNGSSQDYRSWNWLQSIFHWRPVVFTSLTTYWTLQGTLKSQSFHLCLGIEKWYRSGRGWSETRFPFKNDIQNSLVTPQVVYFSRDDSCYDCHYRLDCGYICLYHYHQKLGAFME